MTIPRDYTPDTPFFERVQQLQAEVAKGGKTIAMAAGQLIADGYPIEFRAARTMVVAPVDHAAQLAMSRVGRAVAQKLRAQALDLQQATGVAVDPTSFADRAVVLAGGFETGAVDIGSVAQAFHQEFGLPADTAIEVALSAIETYRAAMFDKLIMQVTCSELEHVVAQGNGGAIAY